MRVRDYQKEVADIFLGSVVFQPRIIGHLHSCPLAWSPLQGTHQRVPSRGPLSSKTRVRFHVSRMVPTVDGRH